MFLHNRRLMYTVRTDAPDPAFAKLLLEQFGGANGELAAALRYFTQAWNDPDERRRGMLLDIATEELSHLEMIGQLIVLNLKNAPPAKVDQLEDSYLSELLEGDHDRVAQLAWTSGSSVLSGGGPRLTDSEGNPFTAAWIDTLGEPVADLHSDVAAEARAKIVYERLVKYCDDPGVSDALTFLMSREVAHQKMFEAALAAIAENFPPGRLAGDRALGHLYVEDSSDGGLGSEGSGFQLAQANSEWGFELDREPLERAPGQEVL